jgi:hypothetical protein
MGAKVRRVDHADGGFGVFEPRISQMTRIRDGLEMPSSFRSVKSVKSVVEFPRPCVLPPRHHQRRKSRHGQRQNRQP